MDCFRYSCFNPRLPRGKATVLTAINTLSASFNPRLPRGKATADEFFYNLLAYVSIHAFREGRRRHTMVAIALSTGFNPRLPRGKATQVSIFLRQGGQFQSTPSAREGDSSPGSVYQRSSSFQSTPSAREGDCHLQMCLLGHPKFQSTPSAREGDMSQTRCATSVTSFNPRLPRGKATTLM